jgi:hypothetical protein
VHAAAVLWTALALGDTGDTGDTGSDTAPPDTGVADPVSAQCQEVLASDWLPDSLVMLEGAQVELPLDDCVLGLGLRLRTATGASDTICVVEGDRLLCTAGQDGPAIIVADVQDRTGAVRSTRWMGVTVVNAPPLLSVPFPSPGCAGLSRPFGNVETTVTVWQAVDHTFVAVEPVDSLTWSFEDGPPGLQVNSDGVVHWQPTLAEVGDWSPTLVVRDGTDEARQTYTLHVVATPFLTTPFDWIGGLTSGAGVLYAASRRRAWPTGRTTARQHS